MSCMYCNDGLGGYPIFEFGVNGANVGITIIDDKLSADAINDGDDNGYFIASERIRYCPVCGKDLISNIDDWPGKKNEEKHS